MRQTILRVLPLLGLGLGLGLTLGLVAAAATAQPADYPSHAVTLVVPFPPGGGTDVSARIVAQKLAAKWGQPVTVDNRSGAAGLVGAEFVARSKADGYTLLMGNLGTQAINPSLYANMPYDADRAFTPIAQVAELPMVLVVNPGVPARTVAELVSLAQQRPGYLSYGSSGSGGAPHMAAELFKRTTGIDILHAPYRGGGPAMAELLAGRVQLAFTTVLEASPQLKVGRLRALAVTGEKRVASLPEVPTLGETIAPGFTAISWNGLLAPAGTPRAIVEKIAGDLREAMAAEETRRRIIEAGGVPIGSTPAQFGKLIDDERRRYSKIVQAAGIKVD